jgi:hypothetical protein
MKRDSLQCSPLICYVYFFRPAPYSRETMSDLLVSAEFVVHVVGAVHTLNPADPHSLKPPGFKPRTYQVETPVSSLCAFSNSSCAATPRRCLARWRGRVSLRGKGTRPAGTSKAAERRALTHLTCTRFLFFFFSLFLFFASPLSLIFVCRGGRGYIHSKTHHLSDQN